MLNDEDFGFIVSEQTGDKVEFIDAVLDYCVKVGLFSKEMFNEGVYTSKGVQERYLTMCKASKRNIVFSEYNLISSEEMGINSEEMGINSEKIPQSKGKESKVNISFLEKKKQKSECEKKIDLAENENSSVVDLQGKTSPQVAPAPPPDSEELKKTKKRFVPPTPEEVQDYCNERGNGISGQQFCDFYASKGWKVGSQPMKDWRASVRTWEGKRRETIAPTSQVSPMVTSPKRFYYDENGVEITY